MAKADIELSDIEVSLANGRRLFAIPRLEIKSGTHVLVKGPSGCGKTSFLHLLAGLYRPQKGGIKIGETSLGELSEGSLCQFRRQHIGVIFQKLNILDHLTVKENIFLVANNIDVLSEVQLAERANERCSVLSLGEQQRVAVARVLAQAPPLILADEPTSSLDRTNGEFVMQALKKVSKGKTLVVVSHDERIEKYFDRVLDFTEWI